MRYNTETKFSETVGIKEEVKFSISSNIKAFHAQMSELYPNPAKAVIREICTNAYDSHIEAGIEDTPFDIYMPTEENKQLVIRDYGVGMSHDMVMTVFSTLFESTKDTSNQANGMFGIGSKSPFSVTDSFYINCFDGDNKRVYFIYTHEDGYPRIGFVGEYKSDELRGVEFVVPFEDKSFVSQFQDELMPVLLGLPKQPNVHNYKPTYPDVIFKGPNYRVYRQLGMFDHTNIRQGSVLYAYTHYDYKININDYFIVIDVPMGSCMVSTNRETLKLTDLTRKFISETYKDVLKHMDSETQKTLQEAPTYPDACRAISKYTNIRKNAYIWDFSWNGFPCRPQFTIPNFTAIEKKKVSKSGIQEKTAFIKTRLSTQNSLLMDWHSIKESYVFIIRHYKPKATYNWRKKIYSKVESLIGDKLYINVVILKLDKNCHGLESTQQMTELLYNQVPEDRIFFIDELKSPKSEPVRRDLNRVRLLPRTRTSFKIVDAKRTADEDVIYWLPCKTHMSADIGGASVTSYELSEMLSHFYDLQDKEERPDVYVLSKLQQKIIKDDNRWERLDHKISKWFHSKVNRNDVAYYYAYSTLSHSPELIALKDIITKHWEKITPSTVKPSVYALKQAIKSKNDNDQLRYLSRVVRITDIFPDIKAIIKEDGYNLIVEHTKLEQDILSDIPELAFWLIPEDNYENNKHSLPIGFQQMGWDGISEKVLDYFMQNSPKL